MKVKQRISARIQNFDIDCIILDEELEVNIMKKKTWEVRGRPNIIASFGNIGLFKGKLVTLCGKITSVPIIVNGTSTEEEFEVIRFVKDNAPFSIFLGKTWIVKINIRREEEEHATERKNKNLRDLIAKRLDQLREE